MRRLGTLALAAALLSGCATQAPQQGAASIDTPARQRKPVVRSIAVSAADYVASAASTSLFIIKASEQIAARPSDIRLGNFARQLRSEQQGIGSQLSFAGRRLNLLPSATLLPRDQALLNELAQSSDPGSTYVRQMKSVLAQGIALHRQYQRYGTSPTLRPVAAMAAPVMERELKAIRRY